MKIPVRKTIKIPDGKKLGVIINIRYRARPFEYVDLEIEFNVDDQKVKMRAGYPQIITPNSKLGILLERFGEKLYEDVAIDPDEVLIGKKCMFRTYTETNKKGTFSKIDETSVRPISKLNIDDPGIKEEDIDSDN